MYILIVLSVQLYKECQNMVYLVTTIIQKIICAGGVVKASDLTEMFSNVFLLFHKCVLYTSSVLKSSIWSSNKWRKTTLFFSVVYGFSALLANIDKASTCQPQRKRKNMRLKRGSHLGCISWCGRGPNYNSSKMVWSFFTHSWFVWVFSNARF